MDLAELEELRARYRAERDRRLRPDGNAQYTVATGTPWAADPWTTVPERAPVDDEVDVLVLGGGFGGLCAAARLREAGQARIRIVDTAGDFGGTWYWNRYPGVACDTEAYVYLPLLEEVGGEMPSRKYTPGAENLRHARAIGERYDLYRDTLFGTRVTAMTWDDGRWDVRTDRGDRTRARYVVNAGGVLTHPKLPSIAGIGDFRGHMFHTSRWDYAYTGGTPSGGRMDRLADKRVALIGTGATAIQVVPHLARDAGHLCVVQRTPSTVDTRDDRPTDPAWWDALPSGWQRRRRENFLALLDGRDTGGEDLVADRWTDTAPVRGIHRRRRTAGTEEPALAAELADAEKMAELRARVDDVVTDPATAAALKPWYRQMCKRPGFSDHYLQAFNRENVTLLDTAGRGVERITAGGLVVGGVETAVDAIILATGFDLGADPAVRAGAEIRGRDGTPLTDYWADGLRTFQGWVSAGYPNLFHLGASQNAASPNFAHILEEQATHAAAVVAEAERRGDVLVEPTPAAQERWVATIRDLAAPTHAFLAECTPGYYNGEGRPRTRSEQFGGGPVEFHALLRSWRENGGVDEVLVPR